MKVRTSSSDAYPARVLMGPTVTLYRYNIAETEVPEGEDGAEARTLYTYSEMEFIDGEYDAVRNGILPAGAEWTDELRRIERSALLEYADECIQEGEDYALTQKGTEWSDYVKAVREYKMAVRATATAKGFPAKVSYPELPEQPL